MNDAIFVGSYSDTGTEQAAPVAVFRPCLARPASILRLGIFGLAGVGALILAMDPELASGAVRWAGVALLLGVCVAGPILFFRKTRLFGTEEHFGVTNLLGEMKLIPRDRLASVEAGEGFRFQATDGTTLMYVKPALWKTSQVRQLTSFLQVPFEVAVDGHGDFVAA